MNNNFNGQQNNFNGQQQQPQNGFGGQQNNFGQQQPQNQQPQNGFGQQSQNNFNGQQQQPQGQFGQNPNMGMQGGQPVGQGGGMMVDNNAAPSEGFSFELVANGNYPVEITNAEFKPETGTLTVENTIFDHEKYARRKIFDFYTMQHENLEWQNRGQSNYAKLCLALFPDGSRPQNPAALIGKRYVATVYISKPKKVKETWGESTDQQEPKEPQNRVSDRLPLTVHTSSNQAMSQGQFGQQGQQQPQNQPQQPQGQFNGQQQQPQGGNFNGQQQPQNGGQQNPQQQPQNNGAAMGQPNQPQNNGQGNQSLPQGGAAGFAGNGMNQQQPQGQLGQQGQQQPQGNGFPNGGGTQFGQM